MNVLIVYAHPEPKSFDKEILKRSIESLATCGHTAAVSDLYEMDFNPVASANDFEQHRFPDCLQYDREQKRSSQIDGFSADIQVEIEKLKRCNLLILQFPLWWFSVPAIMKGWIDRVLVSGQAYGQGKRLETGGASWQKSNAKFQHWLL